MLQIHCTQRNVFGNQLSSSYVMASEVCPRETVICVQWLQMFSKWTSNIADFLLVYMHRSQLRYAMQACEQDAFAAYRLYHRVIKPTVAKLATLAHADKKRAEDLRQFLNAVGSTADAMLDCEEIGIVCRVLTQGVSTNFKKLILFMSDSNYITQQLSQAVDADDDLMLAQAHAFAILLPSHPPLKRFVHKVITKRLPVPYNRMWHFVLEQTGLADIEAQHEE